MDALRIGLSTQTPLLRFVPGSAAVAVTAPHVAVSSAQLVENQDYELTPGGVCRMVLPTLQAWNQTGRLRDAHWFSLQPQGPRMLAWDGLPLTLHHLTLPKEELAAYARTKEKLWADIHGIETARFGVEDFRFYSRYNAFTADALLAATGELDVVYVHDFQLLQVGALVGLAAPSVLRWHVPFDPGRIPPYTRNFLVRAMEAFDAVIVSTRRDLEGLLRAGYRGIARQLYPHIDPADWPSVPRAEGARVEAEWGLRADDPVVLCVARMDPMKRQDLAIRALARIRHRHPRAKLVLVGNGSFSGSSSGGLALSKAHLWAQELQRLAAELRVADRVVFTHYVPNRTLAALYRRADVAVLPSEIEGFGLTVLESWHYGKPCIVSKGIGASELVHEGTNGHVFPSGDDAALADHLDRLLSDADLRTALGDAGRSMGRTHHVEGAAAREAEVMDEAVHRFGED
jgi:glycosyltransferase involved in cell wall biosynthesis